jgi:hypothetical protein
MFPTRRRIMTKTMVTVAACATLLWAGAVLGAQDPGAKCQQQRYNAAAKYAACQQKALGKYFGKGDNIKFDLANRKCTVKYAATWTKLIKIGVAPCSGSRFAVTDSGATVTDNLTGLVWEVKTTAVGSGQNGADRHDVDNNYTWSTSSPYINEDGTAYSDFLSNVNSGGFAGANGWRLPTLVELEAIRDLSGSKPYGCSGPCIDSTFGPTQSHGYWSATTSVEVGGDPPRYAWAVRFSDGTVTFAVKSVLEYGRAVRGGL